MPEEEIHCLVQTRWSRVRPAACTLHAEYGGRVMTQSTGHHDVASSVRGQDVQQRRPLAVVFLHLQLNVGL